MIEERTENTVYFILDGFECDLNVIADIMQIDDYQGWSKGSPKPYRKGISCKSGLWEIKSPLEQYKAIEEHVSWIVELLLPKLNALKMIYRRYAACSELSSSIINYNENHTGFHLSQEVIKKVSMLKASVDIDVYNL